MLIAVFIFLFFTQTLLRNAFFPTPQEVLYHGNAQEIDDKSFEFNPTPAKPKLFGELLTLALAEDLERNLTNVQLLALS